MKSHEKFDVSTLAAHFHNTYDRAVENLFVALSLGIRTIDSSVAGIGGCPYAKGASGNVATEDVLFLCELLGLDHGVDVAKILGVGTYISEELGRVNLAKVSLEDFEDVDNIRKESFGILADTMRLKRL